MKLWGS